MNTHLFLNTQRTLRNGWWILIFFLVMAALLIPAMIMAQQKNMEVTIGTQAFIVMIASFISQLLRRRPLTELVGSINRRWLKSLFLGSMIGSALMLTPALILRIFGWVRWQWNPSGLSSLAPGLLLFAGVALTEELLFRGFIFQRLIAGLGQWIAQLIIAIFFLLTHLNNPGMVGGVKLLASINIFLASILFGLAFMQTKSLAMPLGIHFMANWVQGSLLGFGVSGAEQSGVLIPVFREVPVWLTGGQFGLEASLPGLISILIFLIMLYMRNQQG